jgi:hypothetical protein
MFLDNYPVTCQLPFNANRCQGVMNAGVKPEHIAAPAHDCIPQGISPLNMR